MSKFKGYKYKIGQLIKPNEEGLRTFPDILENKAYFIKDIRSIENRAGFGIDIGLHQIYTPAWFEPPIDCKSIKVLYEK